MRIRTTAYDGKYLIGLAALFAAYFAAAWAGLRLAAVSGFAAPVWFPTGIAVAALVVYGRRYWPAVAAAAFLVNAVTGAPPLVAAVIAAGNAAEALLAFHILRSIGFDPDFRWSRDVFLYVSSVALGCTLVSATVGVTGLLMGGVILPSAFAQTWVAWWVGDAIGALVVAPFLMTWRRGASVPYRRPSLPECAAFGAFVTLIMLVIYVLPANPWVSGAYFSLLPLIWAALRFGTRGAALTTFAISVFTIAATYYRNGPFGSVESVEAGLIHLQIFTGVASVTALLMSSLMAEKERSLQEIERINNALEKRLRSAGDPREKEKALRSAEAQTVLTAAMNRALLHDRTEAMIVFDSSGRQVAMNDAASRLVGKGPLSFFGPDGKKPLARPKSAEEAEVMVVSNARPKGVLVWASARRLKDDDGTVVGTALTVREALSTASRAADALVAQAAASHPPKE